MDILIKNMEMPSDCYECDYHCGLNIIARADDTQKHPSCPLIPVPEHGRLIDVDVYIKTEMDEYRKHGDEYSKERAETIADVLAVLDKHTPVVLERTTWQTF